MRIWILLLFAPSVWGASFTAPLGVPVPTFGITNTHWIYTNSSYTFDYGSGLVAYRTTANGPYTHYVDKTHPSATDTANTFGTPSIPRKTWPAEFGAGTVLEIHNGPYTFKNLGAKLQTRGWGTSNAPVFVRGVSPNDMASIGADMTIMGTFIIFEHIDTYKQFLVRLSFITPTNVNDLAIRDCHFHGVGNESGSSAAIGGMGFFDWSAANVNYVSNIVVWNNSIHGYGPIVTGEEHDWVGVTAGGYGAFNVWILDNDIYDMGGDSVRIGSNSDSAHPPTSHFAYVSRNLMHDNGENSLDVKMFNDAVISENLMYGGFASASSSGARVATHYDPTNIWLLANTMYDAPKGLGSSGVEDVYVLGNVFHHITGRAVELFGGGDIHFVQNTLVQCSQGIVNIGGSLPYVPIINTIFSQITNQAIGYDLSGFVSSRMDHNLVYQDGGPLNVQWAGPTYTSLVTLSNSTAAGDFCMNVDPIYLNAATNNFNINTNSSPAYGTGTNIAVYTDLFFQRFGVSIDSYFKPNGTNMIGAYLTVVPDQPPAPEPVTGTRHPRGGRRFNIR